MAESIFLHFSEARWLEVTLALKNFGFCESKQGWRYPTDEEFGVTVYGYDEVVDEMENEDWEKLLQYFGDKFPSCILCIELRGSRMELAISCSKEIIIYLLGRFQGLADDAVSNYWTLEEIVGNVRKRTGHFLDCYAPLD